MSDGIIKDNYEVTASLERVRYIVMYGRAGLPTGGEAGDVLTSDGAGGAYWAPPSGEVLPDGDEVSY